MHNDGILKNLYSYHIDGIILSHNDEKKGCHFVKEVNSTKRVKILLRSRIKNAAIPRGNHFLDVRGGGGFPPFPPMLIC